MGLAAVPLLVGFHNPSMNFFGFAISGMGLMAMTLVASFEHAKAKRLWRERAQFEASAERENLLISNAPIGMITIDELGIVQQYNKAAEKIFGYSEREIVAQKVNVLMSGADSKLHDDSLKTYLETKVSRVLGASREVMGKHRSGQLIPLRIRRDRVEYHGQCWFVAAIEDLTHEKSLGTELTKIQLLAKSIFESITDMLIVLNQQGSIESVNERALQLLGYDRKEILEVRPDEIVCLDYTGAGEMTFMERMNLKIQESKLLDCSLNFRTRAGKLIPVLLTGSALKGENGEVTGIVLAAKDARESALVKELRQTQLQLVQQGKMAALGELSSGIGHELNNPLHFIKGFNDLTRAAFEKGGPVHYSEVKGFLENVDRNCERMRNTIEHFREFAGNSNHKFRQVSINQIIQNSFILLNEQMKLSGIRINWQLAENGPSVMGDPNKLEQALISFFNNAREAIERAHGVKGGEISVRTQIEVDSVIVTIQDNGCGIAKEKMNRIFDPFFTTKETGKGSGLGLSIAHSVVKEHNGEITCDSVVGEGTTFAVTLPLYRDKGEVARAG